MSKRLHWLSMGLLLASMAPAGVIEDSGVQGGLVVKIGCGDVDELAALKASGRFVVQVLDADAAKVAAAREALAGKGLYGPVSVTGFDGKSLPYVDGLVNLLVADAGCGVAKADGA
jgi:hypothetical protein